MPDHPPRDYAEPTRSEILAAHRERRRARREHGLSVLKLLAFVALAVAASAVFPVLLFLVLLWSSKP